MQCSGNLEIEGTLLVAGLLFAISVYTGMKIVTRLKSRPAQKVTVKDNFVYVDRMPRTANGWPMLEIKQFTDNQLIAEASSWINTAKSTSSNTVGSHEFKKYTDELIRRNLMTHIMQRQYILPEMNRETTE